MQKPRPENLALNPTTPNPYNPKLLNSFKAYDKANQRPCLQAALGSASIMLLVTSLAKPEVKPRCLGCLIRCYKLFTARFTHRGMLLLLSVNVHASCRVLFFKLLEFRFHGLGARFNYNFHRDGVMFLKS